MDRYELQDRLGRGGMGEVLRAYDRALGRFVAIKTVLPDHADRFRDRFLVEVRLAARIAHPHLLPALDTGVLPDGRPFMALPLARGSLGTVRGWDALLPRLLEVLAALGAIHARGVLHRDLKPENVLLVDGRAAVADLGLAVLAQDARPDRAGTPRFMAPEQRAGEVELFGPPLDLYGFGALVADVVGDDPVPEGLAAVIDACLQPAPGDRPPLAADVARLLEGLGPPARALPRRLADLAAGATLPDVDTSWPEVAPVPALSLPPAPPLPEEPPAEPVVPVRPSPALFALREPPLVGRDAERRALWADARAVATAGRPRASVVVGEVGVGKSRLVASVVRALEEGGHARNLRVAREVPSADEVRRRLADGVRRGLGVLWLDEATPQALDLARALCGRPEPVWVVACVRREERDVVGEALAELRAGGAREVAVDRLGPEATRELLSASIALQAEVLAAAAARCEGNPLVAHHLVRHWADAGALVDDGGLRYSLVVAAQFDDPVPADVGALMLGRVRAAVAASRAPAEADRAVVRLALAGHAVPDPVFAELAGAAAGDLLGGGLFRRGTGEVRWDHGMLADALREASAPTVDDWRAVALAYTRWSGDSRAADAQVGLALHAAGDHAKALPHLLRAGGAALGGHGPSDLQRLGDAAVASAAVAGSPADRWAAARLRVAALIERGANEEAAAAATEALAGELGGPEAAHLTAMLARIQRGLGRRNEAHANAARALALAGDDPLATADALTAAALLARGDARPDEAEALWHRAAEAAVRGGEPRQATRMRLRLVDEVLLAFGRLDHAEAIALAALETEEGGRLRAQALRALAIVASRRGDPDAAEGHIREAIATLVASGASGGPALRATLGEVLAARKDFVGARAVFEAWLRYAEELGDVTRIVGAWANLADLAAEAGEPAQLALALDVLDRVGGADQSWRVHFALLRAQERALRDDRMGVRTALHGVTPVRADAMEGRTIERLAATLAERGWPEELDRVHEIGRALGVT